MSARGTSSVLVLRKVRRCIIYRNTSTAGRRSAAFSILMANDRRSSIPTGRQSRLRGTRRCADSRSSTRPLSDKPVLVSRRTFREKSTLRRTGLKRTRRSGTAEAVDVSAIPVPCAAARAATTTLRPAIEWSLPGVLTFADDEFTSSYSLTGRRPIYPRRPSRGSQVGYPVPRACPTRECASCGRPRGSSMRSPEPEASGQPGQAIRRSPPSSIGAQHL